MNPCPVIFVSLLLAASPGTAADAPSPADDSPQARPTAASVIKLGDTRFRVGDVEFDSKTRTIRFPAAINMRDGLLEYAIVHQNGKVHESLLHTSITASHLNIAFKLLRYQASGELFPIPEEDGTPSDRMPVIDEKTRTSARVSVRVHWKDEQTEKSASLHEWIANANTEQAMEPGPWLYTGSYLIEKEFQADTTGDIAAIFTAQTAVLNYPGKDNNNDEVWTALTKRIPPEGTRVTVEIAPWKP